ncbi:MAG: polyprenyl synthetase family protein [Thermacetogeniaceae bacterium]
MNWEEELKRKAAMINEALDHYLPPADRYPIKIHEAMRYSLFAGGKRLRGALLLSVAEMLEMDPKRVLPAAASVEMIHTYSLIHDDLPAMDDDDFRRGKPTCHRVFGEAIAILAGDALLTLAFQTLGELKKEGFSSDLILGIVDELSRAAGTEGLIGGQVVDLESEGVEVGSDTLAYIHEHKTGALFCAAVRAGAILAGAGEAELQALTDYAKAFGLAFQITDDILDVIGDEKEMGKPAKSDAAKKKATYPAVFGLEESRHIAAEQVRKALHSLKMFGARAAFLEEAARYLLQRKS